MVRETAKCHACIHCEVYIDAAAGGSGNVVSAGAAFEELQNAASILFGATASPVELLAGEGERGLVLVSVSGMVGVRQLRASAALTGNVRGDTVRLRVEQLHGNYNSKLAVADAA